MEYSGNHAPPPSFSSSGGLRSIEPQFPSYDEYATKAPSISSTTIKNSESQLPTDGQRAVADEYDSQPPSYSGLQHGQNSINGYAGDRYVDQTVNGGQAPDLDATVRENNSATGFNNVYSGYEQPPSYSGMTPLNRSNPGGSGAATTAVDPPENVGFSIVGRNFPRQNVMGPYNY